MPPAQAFTYIPGNSPVIPRQPEFWRQFYACELKEGTTFDNYGVAYEPGSEYCYHMRHMCHPLENATELEELRAYPYPQYPAEPSPAQIRAVEECHARGGFAAGGMECSIWETAWYTRGMEALMMDMMAEPELAEYVLDVVTANSVNNATAFAKAGVDGLLLGDDIGMQRTIMMSRDLYCRYLKSRLKKVIDAARAIKPDIIVMYHSYGYVTPFIRDLIEVGVDVLNSVQPECMDFREINAEFGNEISFCGTLGTQTLMPFGTPEEVTAKVNEYLDLMGEKGGLLVCPTHVMEPEVPVENVVAYLEACRSYRVRK